jgi:hypothetical protein
VSANSGSSSVGGRLAAIAATAVFCAVGLILFGIGLWLFLVERGDERQIEERAVMAPGEIVRKQIVADRARANEPRFQLQYRFATPGGEDIVSSSFVDRETYERARAGSRLAVFRLPEAPSVHRIDGELRDRLTAPALMALGGLFLLVAAIVLYAAKRGGESPTRLSALVAEAPMKIFGWGWLAVGVTLVLAGFAALAFDLAADARFETEASRATATVLEKFVTGGSGSGTDRKPKKHWVTFRYRTSAGDDVVATLDIQGSAWTRLAEQGPIELSYLRDEPWAFRLASGKTEGVAKYILFGMGALGLGLGGAALAYESRRVRGAGRRRKRRAARSTQAQVGASVSELRLASRMPLLARLAALLPRSWGVAGIASLFMAAGLAAFASGVGDLALEWRYARSGALAEGRVHEKPFERAAESDGGATRFALLYRFAAADGTVVDGRHTVPREVWEAAKSGDRIAVRYLSAAPRFNRAARESGTSSGLVGVTIGTLISAGGGAVLFLMAYAWRRRRRLIESGIAVRAVIVAVVPTGRSKSSRSVLRYRFHDALGAAHEGRSEPMPPAETTSWPPGEIGEVRYDAANPDDHIWVGAAGPPRRG